MFGGGWRRRVLFTQGMVTLALPMEVRSLRRPDLRGDIDRPDCRREPPRAARTPQFSNTTQRLSPWGARLEGAGASQPGPERSHQRTGDDPLAGEANAAGWMANEPEGDVARQPRAESKRLASRRDPSPNIVLAPGDYGARAVSAGTAASREDERVRASGAGRSPEAGCCQGGVATLGCPARGLSSEVGSLHAASTQIRGNDRELGGGRCLQGAE